MVDQDRFSFKVGTVPQRLVERAGWTTGQVPARFIGLKTFFEAPHLKQGQRSVPLAVDMIFVQTERFIEAAERGIRLS